mmetsp:Transcript_11584/g.48588  ORF Transcript_11584/g.48588 Transcript_11584/m.48588 type:complete len:238 (-) Transcript_11584:226-939(-)
MSLRPLDAPEHVEERVPLVPLHLLPLLRPREQQRHDRVGLALLLRQPLEHRVLFDLLRHPPPQFLDVGDGVDDPAHRQRVRVLRQQRPLDYPPPVVRGLEVRVGEQEEQLRELTLLKEVGQVLHAVCADARDVLVRTGVLAPERHAPLLHVLAHLIPDLHAHREVVREQRRETHEQTPEAAPHVREPNQRGRIRPGCRVAGSLRVGAFFSGASRKTRGSAIPSRTRRGAGGRGTSSR